MNDGVGVIETVLEAVAVEDLVNEGDTEGEDGTPQDVTQVVPERVPLFGQVYTGVAGCVIVHTEPPTEPPLGQE